MSRDDKRIKKWRSAGTLGELYLKEMAEQGLLLEKMTPLKYIFREDEPQHLRYRIEELEHAPTDEERAEYAKDGWQEVCHYELDYVFAKECSADEPEEPIMAATLMIKPSTCRRKAPTPSYLRCVWKV